MNSMESYELLSDLKTFATTYSDKLTDIQSQLKLLIDGGLAPIYTNYKVLVEKRFNNTLTRQEYMVYDMVDMMLSLQAVMKEITSDFIDPSYMVQKLGRVKGYVDTTYEYFRLLEEEKK